MHMQCVSYRERGEYSLAFPLHEELAQVSVLLLRIPVPTVRTASHPSL
jgi:hypothetical protein